MKITIFTSNQPRHIRFVNELASCANKVNVVMESYTRFPGKLDGFYRKSETMQNYMQNVLSAEREIFPNSNLVNEKVDVFPLIDGDLNFLDQEELAPCLDSDMYVVFGSSFIKGWLLDFLVGKGAINLHMGLSPYYRGAYCNFWALYDGRPNYVGGTIHLLSKGLDSGPILFHSVPNYDGEDFFSYSMKSVLATQDDLISSIRNGYISKMSTFQQDRNKEIRYSTMGEFTDDVANDFMSRDLSADLLIQQLTSTDRPDLQLLH